MATSSNPLASCRQPRRLRAAGLFLVASLCLSGTAVASEPLAAGNAAFRAGDYAEALSHYETALSDASLPTGSRALAEFNTGVALIRLGRTGEAESWLIDAAAEPRLAPRAYYSLGLLHADDPAEARVWFLQALAHPQASPRLRELTREAMTGSGERTATRSAPRRTPTRRPIPLSRAEERLANPFSFSLTTQLAYDSNIYRTPGSEYVDLAQATQPLITPEEQSGWFAPVELATALRWGEREDSEFMLSYNLDGRFYTDSEFSNANELSQRLALSGSLDKRRNPRIKRGTFLYTALAVERHNAEAYDRDTGDDQLLNGEDVSDRLTFTRYGPEFDFHQDLGPFRVGFDGYGFISRYDETVTDLDYSHEQYKLGTFLLYRPWRRTQLELSYGATQRNYDYRPARDLNGDRFSNAPNQEFFYQDAAATVRQRLHRAFWFSLGYVYTDREDQHLGYDDYQRHTVRGALYVDTDRFHARAGVSWRDYEFPNGFAFDTPIGGEKTLTTTVATLRAEYRMGFNLSLHAAATFDIVDTSDLRADYERSQASMGVRWEW